MINASRPPFGGHPSDGGKSPRPVLPDTRAADGNKPILLAVAPDEHYIESVAKTAVCRGLISAYISAANDPADFAEKIGNLDKSNVIIAKGMLETADFLRLILKYNDKELIDGGRDGFLSHCAILQKPRRDDGAQKPLILTDGAINIDPNGEKKCKIVMQAVQTARNMLGLERPVVSILTPSGKPNPYIKASVDGEFIINEIGGAVDVRLDQMDTAISEDIRRIKGLSGKAADILLCDSLASGNEIWKIYAIVGGYNIAGLVCGTTVPVALNSRGDSAESKLLSIAYASKKIN